MSTRADIVPDVACTLSTKGRSAQVLEWVDLAKRAIDSTEVAGGVASTFPVELAAELEDLVDREVSCCGTWLDLTLTRSGDTVRLELTTANPDGLALVRSIAGTDQ